MTSSPSYSVRNFCIISFLSAVNSLSLRLTALYSLLLSSSYLIALYPASVLHLTTPQSDSNEVKKVTPSMSRSNFLGMI